MSDLGLAKMMDVFFNGRPAESTGNNCPHAKKRYIRTPAPERHLITLCFDCGHISWDWKPKR